MGKTKSVENVDLFGRYEAVRDTLLQERFADRMSKPLGYWVLPSDRRLPLAFLGRTLGDLLATPFTELSATPGIGEKKINSLVKLLHRATDDQPPAVPVGRSDQLPATIEFGPSPQISSPGFEPALVSEALWSEWRDIVREFGVGEESLGRLAPSLQNLPTVIWETPLAYYLGYTVAEIRGLRTHGEKRVRCVLEVFHSVAQRLASARPSDNLHELLTAPLIRDVQGWVTTLLQGTRVPKADDVRDRLALPVLQQIHIDSGETVHHLATERLGLSGGPVSVRAQARNLGVTRARIYQLLDDCSKVFHVRWPAGAQQLESIALRFAGEGADAATSRLFFGVRELCFPDKKREPERRNVRTESQERRTEDESTLASAAGLSSS